MLMLLLAQAAATTCPARPVIPAELAGWSVATPLEAAVNTAGIGDAMLPLGRGVGATLPPGTDVTLPVVAKPQAAGTYAGLFAFQVPAAGRYRVALGAAAWVDVVANGAALPSAAHGHGPDCSPIRKMVDYDLKPGRYLLEVSGSARPALALMLARL